jgi:hypothetical protein
MIYTYNTNRWHIPCELLRKKEENYQYYTHPKNKKVYAAYHWSLLIMALPMGVNTKEKMWYRLRLLKLNHTFLCTLCMT